MSAETAEKIDAKIKKQGMGTVYARAARKAPDEASTKAAQEHGRNQIAGIEHELVFEKEVLGKTVRVHKHRWPVKSTERAMAKFVIANTSYDPGTNVLFDLETLVEFRDELTKMIKSAQASVKKTEKQAAATAAVVTEIIP